MIKNSVHTHKPMSLETEKNQASVRIRRKLLQKAVGGRILNGAKNPWKERG